MEENYANFKNGHTINLNEFSYIAEIQGIQPVPLPPPLNLHFGQSRSPFHISRQKICDLNKHDPAEYNDYEI